MSILSFFSFFFFFFLFFLLFFSFFIFFPLFTEISTENEDAFDLDAWSIRVVSNDGKGYPHGSQSFIRPNDFVSICT